MPRGAGFPSAIPTTRLRFTITDAPKRPPTQCIVEICDYLATKVLDPLLARNEVKWDRRFKDFFQLDNSCAPLDPIGTIRLEVPPVLIGQMGQLEAAIQSELAKLKIKTAPFAHEGNSGKSVKPVIVISIVDNPTVLAEPPVVNMSYVRGRIVLRDLLGYKYANGRYEFDAEDLLKRLAAVTEEKISACTASPVRDAKAPGGVRSTPSPVSIKAVRRCLEEVQRYAQWALSHRYRRITAA